MHIVAHAVDPRHPPGALGHDLEPFGNTYRVRATYRPSNTPARVLKSHRRRAVVSDHRDLAHGQARIASSARREEVDRPCNGNDFVAAQQVESVVPELGYVVVAGVPGATPVVVSPSGSSSGGSNAVALGLIVAAGVAMLVGLGLVLRNRRA